MLRSEGPEQALALADLRHAMRKGVRRAVANRAGADVVEDLTQEAVMKVMGALATFRGESRFTSWAITIAVRVTFAELRRARWKDISLDQCVERSFDASAVGAGAAPPQREAMLVELERAIATHLTARQRSALVAELKGMPLAAIARDLGSNVNSVYKLTHDARLKLRDALLAGGFTRDDLCEAFELPGAEPTNREVQDE
jgi:RNA polymerase sigma-70 factor (ECF subfamily)